MEVETVEEKVEEEMGSVGMDTEEEEAMVMAREEEEMEGGSEAETVEGETEGEMAEVDLVGV